MSSTQLAAPALAAGLRRVHLALIGVFVFVLPVGEAPKNIVAGLLLITWVALALRTRDLGGRWDRFDTLFALLLGSALVSALVGGYRAGFSDVARLLLVAWIVKRSPLSAADAPRLLLAAIAGLWLALAMGYAEYLAGKSFYLELPSVGHVNQSAQYIALLGMITLAWGFLLKGAARWAKAAVLASAVFFALSLLVTASRAALLAYAVFVAALVLLKLAARHVRFGPRQLVLAAAAVALAAGALVLNQKLRPDSQGLSEKLLVTESVSVRVKHWDLALEGWREKPLLGFGPGAFASFKAADGCTWRSHRGLPCNVTDYVPASHPHNVFVAFLVERGAVGLVIFLLLLLVWAVALASRRTQANTLLWQASAAALCLTIVAGVFNTTFRVEHGALAALLLALWLAADRREPATRL